LRDSARGVALQDAAATIARDHLDTLREPECLLPIRRIEGTQPGFPMNVEGADTMHLDDGSVRRIAEHRAAFRREGVAPGRQLPQRLLAELGSHGKVPGALDHGDVLVDRVRMRWNPGARQFVDAHHEGLPGDVGIAVEDLDVAGHGPQRNDPGLGQPLAPVGALDAGRRSHRTVSRVRPAPERRPRLARGEDRQQREQHGGEAKGNRFAHRRHHLISTA
jgi:hypothetical protein